MTLDELRQVVEDLGYEDVRLFSEPDFADAFIGMSSDNRAVYSYPKMLGCLINRGMDEEEAVEFIEFNTLRALPYYNDSPVVVFDTRQ